MRIGDRTSIGEYSILASHGNLDVGSECMFGPYVFLNAASHIIDGPEPYRFQGEMALGIVVEDGVWLGARCSILDGVTVGERCVVGAHALVLDSLPPRSLAIGQPAYVQKKLGGTSNEGVR